MRSGGPWPPLAKAQRRARGQLIEGCAKNPASRTINHSVLQRLAKALKVTVGELVE